MAQSTKFWDRIAAKYAQQPIADEAAYQKKLQITRDYFRPDMTVLEIGCGTGSTALLHAPYVQHIRAIDFSANMIAIAQAKATAANVTNVTFEQATLEDLQLPAASLDAVLGLSILHLLEHREAAIAQVYTLLKPGGIFVTNTACLGDSMAWFKGIVPLGRALGLLPLVRVFTTQALVDSFTQAGFTLEHQWQPGKNKGVFVVAKKPG